MGKWKGPGKTSRHRREGVCAAPRLALSLFLSCFYQHTHVKHRLSQDCEKSAGKWAFSCGNNSRELGRNTGDLQQNWAALPAAARLATPPCPVSLQNLTTSPAPGQRPTFMPPTSQPPRSTPVLPVSFWGRNRAHTQFSSLGRLKPGNCCTRPSRGLLPRITRSRVQGFPQAPAPPRSKSLVEIGVGPSSPHMETVDLESRLHLHLETSG